MLALYGVCGISKTAQGTHWAPVFSVMGPVFFQSWDPFFQSGDPLFSVRGPVFSGLRCENGPPDHILAPVFIY